VQIHIAIEAAVPESDVVTGQLAAAAQFVHATEDAADRPSRNAPRVGAVDRFPPVDDQRAHSRRKRKVPGPCPDPEGPGTFRKGT
jgi:hypothetical protein